MLAAHSVPSNHTEKTGDFLSRFAFIFITSQTVLALVLFAPSVPPSTSGLLIAPWKFYSIVKECFVFLNLYYIVYHIKYTLSSQNQ